MASLAFITQQIELSEQLRAGRDWMLTPQDLPARYGGAVRDIDRVLSSEGFTSVLAGGWAVWRHGYEARVPLDLDIILGADEVTAFIEAATKSGFEIDASSSSKRTHLRHIQSGLDVDIFVEGMPINTALGIRVRSPTEIGGRMGRLCYITLPALVEMNVASRQARDDVNMIEIIRANPDRCAELREYLQSLGHDLTAHFDKLIEMAAEDDER